MPARARDADEVLEASPSAMIGLLKVGAAGVQTRAASQLQRRVGNHAVQHLLQRDPPPAAPPLTDAQQWELDWNALPAEIKGLTDAIAQSKLDESEAKKDKNAAGIKAQQTLRATLEKTLKAKSADLKKKQKELDSRKKERSRDSLRDYAAKGFLNLSKDFVDAMQGAGLTWGGEWGEASSKDFMHFQE